MSSPVHAVYNSIETNHQDDYPIVAATRVPLSAADKDPEIVVVHSTATAEHAATTSPELLIVAPIATAVDPTIPEASPETPSPTTTQQRRVKTTNNPTAETRKASTKLLLIAILVVITIVVPLGVIGLQNSSSSSSSSSSSETDRVGDDDTRSPFVTSIPTPAPAPSTPSPTDYFNHNPDCNKVLGLSSSYEFTKMCSGTRCSKSYSNVSFSECKCLCGSVNFFSGDSGNKQSNYCLCT